MKILQTDISVVVNSAFAVLEKNRHAFTAPFHAHPQTELVYIKKGAGKRIVGDCIATFEPGDITLIGSNLPHVWMAEQPHDRLNDPCSVVAYFDQSVFSDQFYTLKESRKLADLLAKSKRGICVKGTTRILLASKMDRLPRKHGFKKVIGLMEILHILSTSSDIEFITGEGWRNQSTDNTADRLAEVYQYLNEHYTEDISLEDIARIAHLTPPAFCRLFKNRTRKHFTEYLNEIRISHACNDLQHTDESIIQVSSACGYKTISNFNKSFRKITGLSPKNYRNQFKELTA